MVVVTTLLDPAQASKEELSYMYRALWNHELDLRAIKSTMQMEFLRCKTPELVRKEVWAHVLAYNLIRAIIAKAATKHKIEPRSISFKATIQTLEAFQPLTAHHHSRRDSVLLSVCEQLLDAISWHRVGDRPDGFEPRLQERRDKRYPFLRKQRATLQQQMAKRVT